MNTQEQAAFDLMREALEGMMRWQVKNVKVWHNSAYDIAHEALAAAKEVQGCEYKCTAECLAKMHGCASECPALPWQPQAQGEACKPSDNA